MKILKQLSKLIFKITLILFFYNFSFANEPIDIWKIEKKDIINLLPHREPMLLIDELSDIIKLKSAKAIVNVVKIISQRYLIFNLRVSEKIQTVIAPALIIRSLDKD